MLFNLKKSNSSWIPARISLTFTGFYLYLNFDIPCLKWKEVASNNIEEVEVLKYQSLVSWVINN